MPHTISRWCNIIVHNKLNQGLGQSPANYACLTKPSLLLNPMKASHLMPCS